MTNHYTLRSLDQILNVTTYGKIPPFEQWWHEAIVTVPEIVHEPETLPGSWQLVLEYHETGFDFIYRPENKEIIYRGRPQFQEIGLLMTSIFERMHAQNGAFTLHASALQTPGQKGWVFFGESFSGKTAALINLEKKLPGLKYIGNERVLISSAGEIIGGTSAVRVKAGDYSEAQDPNRELYHYDDFFRHRIHRASIHKVVQIKLHQGVGSVIKRTFTRKRSLATIYGHLGEVLHNMFLLLDNMQRPAPSFATPELNQKRLLLANAIVEKSPVTLFSGNVDELMEFILEEENIPERHESKL